MDNVGKLVYVDGNIGKILYYGPVEGKEGEFYGIDWDNLDRGKHDGTFQGKRYFKTSGPKSGSFVIPSKVSFGRSFDKVFVEQYLIDDDDPNKGLQSNVFLNRDVEFVNRDKILNFLKTCNNLKLVSFNKTDIKYFEPTDLYFPRCTMLTIANSLLNSWEILAKITSLFPRLNSLNILSNHFESLSEIKDLNSCVNKPPITVLSANNCGLNNESVKHLFDIFPHIRELHVASNKLNKIEIPEHYQNLEELYLYNNKIEDFNQLKSLSRLSKLKYLSISDCCLKSVTIDSGFPSLETLVADGNQFTKWEDIQELGKLKNLKNLTLKCLIPGECGVDTREIIIAKLRNLISLDHCDISPLERKNSERQFLKGIGVIRPIAKVHYEDVDILAEKHDFTFGDTSETHLDDFVNMRFKYGEKWYEKDFPLSMDLIRVATLVCRILGGNPRKMEYFYRQSDGIFEPRMVAMNPSRTLFSLDLCSENLVVMIDKTD